jgi:hypothetical protein
MVALDELKNLDLHDQSVDGLQIDLSSKKIVVKLDIYNEETSNYDYREIIFTGIEKLALTELNLDDLSCLEIFSHEVVETSDNPVIKFLLLTGIGKASAEISFSFSDYQIRT